jgi:hypothetical protein
MKSADPLVGFRFRLLHPDGKQESLIVDAERALIGSASHCEVRLPPEIAAHEHVEVIASDGAIHFATRPYGLRASLPVVDGISVVEGRWEAGSTLALGNVQMSVELVDLTTAKAKPPILLTVIAAVTILSVVTIFTLARPRKHSNPPVPPAPVLLPPKETAVCPNVSHEQRPVLAAEKLRVALAKRERSPFVPSDGFEAVILFETAAACFRFAGDPAEGTQADQAADALRLKLDEDYRLRRIRLEHAYWLHATPVVKRELAVLIPMTAHVKGAYTEWLLSLDRAATLELEQKGHLN